MKKINWKIIILVLLVILIIAGILGLYFYKRNSKSQSSEQENTSSTNNYYQGQVEYIEGQVEKKENSELGWLNAEKSDLVKLGNEIRTFNDSRAVITFEDGSALRMDADTEISFQSQENNIEVILKKGTIFNKVAKNETRTYTVAAGEFKVVALGTAFIVEQEDNNETKVMVLESQVQITDKDKNEIEKIETGEKAKLEKESIKQENIEEKDTEDKFIAWSIKEEKLENIIKEEEKKEEEKEEKTTPTSQIILTGSKSDKGVKLYWKTEGVSIPNGFKLVKSTSKNPVYPGNEYVYLSNKDIRSYEWKIDTGKQYYFRVCAYQTNGKCGLYSNNLYLDTPSSSDDDDDGYASKVSLSVSEDDDYVKLNWSISGGSAPQGFKIVTSTDKNPTYPKGSGQDNWAYVYLDDDDARGYKWKKKDFEDDEKYYFRVCVYLGGKCGTYSDNVSVEF